MLVITILISIMLQAGCQVSIPDDQTWHGKTMNGTGGIYGKNTDIHIVRIASNIFRISDFSGGFFESFGYGNNFPADVEFDCNAEIIPAGFPTEFGNCSISGGNWDSLETSITIKWVIEENHISEESYLILSR